MKRALRALVLTGAVLGAAAASAAGAPTAPPVHRPDPFLTNITLDYAEPLPAPGGGAATLAPLGRGAAGASVRDLAFLRYRSVGDWGGFLPAPVDRLALGEPVGGARSFTYLPGAQNGGGPVVRQQPPPSPPATTTPGNGCFGGCAPPPGRRRRHGGRGRSGAAGSCGTAGLAITSDRPHCRILVLNRKPGDSGYEHVTVTNTSSSRYVLSLQAAGDGNPLWDELEMGVWKSGGPPPDPLPPLRFWRAQYTRLATLSPGQSVHLTIALHLPQTAGNADQRLRAAVDFQWRAVPTAHR